MNKDNINQILAVLAMAMGITVIVLGIVDLEFTAAEGIRMLGIAAVALGALAFNHVTKKS